MANDNIKPNPWRHITKTSPHFPTACRRNLTAMKPQKKKKAKKVAPLEKALRHGFARWLKEQRTRAGVSQSEWAAGVGLSGGHQKTLWSWENHVTRPRSSEIFSVWVSWIAQKQKLSIDPIEVWGKIVDQANLSLPAGHAPPSIEPIEDPSVRNSDIPVMSATRNGRYALRIWC